MQNKKPENETKSRDCVKYGSMAIMSPLKFANIWVVFEDSSISFLYLMHS